MSLPVVSANDTYAAMSNTHATLAIALNATSAAKAFAVLKGMISGYQTSLADQWDVRDIASANEDPTVGGPSPDPSVPLRPVCNSHYARQLNIWQVVHAWSGQEFDAHFRSEHADQNEASGLLSLRPHPQARSFLVLLPGAFGLVDLLPNGRLKVCWLRGELKVAEIRLHGEIKARVVALLPGSRRG